MNEIKFEADKSYDSAGVAKQIKLIDERKDKEAEINKTAEEEF